MRRIRTAVQGRLSSIGDSERGMVAIWTALLMVVLLGMAAIAVDIARWYVEAQRLQKTVDAAALAGVVYMPGNLAKADASAQSIILANGWDPNKVLVAKEKSPSGNRYRVTMSSKVTNQFGAVLGLPVTTVTRTAVADFRPPATIGSACNLYGNEPWATSTESGSRLPVPTPPVCNSNPQFWASVTGPEVFKVQGDRYGSRKCKAGESGCTGSVNDEFDPRGYVMTVRVKENLSGPLTVELYDPAYVESHNQCKALPAVGSDVLGTNTYTKNAKDRYANKPDPLASGAPSYCSGDEDNTLNRYPQDSAAPDSPTVTSFGLLKPNDSRDPFAPASNAGGKQICSVQYPGYAKGNDRVTGADPWVASAGSTAPEGNATEQLSSNNELTRVFHQWVPFCTIPAPVQAGDYYLRVRTNVPWGQPSAVFSQVGDAPTVTGNGSNRFSVRAVPGLPTDAAKVQVSPYTRMPVYTNSPGSKATFNLIRVLPSGAGQSIGFSFFDIGDAAAGGTLSVLAPPESGYRPKECKKDGKENGTAPDCQITGIQKTNGWDGQNQRMSIPIPADYTCNVSDPFGCWWRVQVDFAGSAVYDQTTWTATLEGDPVRVVE